MNQLRLIVPEGRRCRGKEDGGISDGVCPCVGLDYVPHSLVLLDSEEHWMTGLPLLLQRGALGVPPIAEFRGGGR
jgi:hypothetical protein